VNRPVKISLITATLGVAGFYLWHYINTLNAIANIVLRLSSFKIHSIDLKELKVKIGIRLTKICLETVQLCPDF
jgi:hypothetical protein